MTSSQLGKKPMFRIAKQRFDAIIQRRSVPGVKQAASGNETPSSFASFQLRNGTAWRSCFEENDRPLRDS